VCIQLCLAVSVKLFDRKTWALRGSLFGLSAVPMLSKDSVGEKKKGRRAGLQNRKDTIHGLSCCLCSNKAETLSARILFLWEGGREGPYVLFGMAVAMIECLASHPFFSAFSLCFFLLAEVPRPFCLSALCFYV
jgi:hypothetical protein